MGYIFVDMMVLLSAFCLTLPIARSMILGEGVDDACTFYKKRFARIYPSYLLAVLISFGFQLWWGNYPTVSYAVRDLLSHLTFTHMFRADTYIYAPINGVLWTVALEVQFYVLFPLLVKLFRKSPLLFWGTLTGFGALFIYQYALKQDPVNMQVNQLPTFLPVFANGMLAAYLFTLYCVKAPYKRLWGVFFTALAVVGAVLIRNEIVSAQIAADLEGIPEEDVRKLTIAYEPIWAIGTGKTATPEIAEAAHAHIRGELAAMFGAEVAEKVRIQYGGSMKSANARELVAQKDIDGGLIGGAALKAGEFAALIREALGK